MHNEEMVFKKPWKWPSYVIKTTRFNFISFILYGFKQIRNEFFEKNNSKEE